jgi:hypothetical protein
MTLVAIGSVVVLKKKGPKLFEDILVIRTLVAFVLADAYLFGGRDELQWIYC